MKLLYVIVKEKSHSSVYQQGIGVKCTTTNWHWFILLAIVYVQPPLNALHKAMNLPYGSNMLHI